jgi:hypothetical protein
VYTSSTVPSLIIYSGDYFKPFNKFLLWNIPNNTCGSGSNSVQSQDYWNTGFTFNGAIYPEPGVGTRGTSMLIYNSCPAGPTLTPTPSPTRTPTLTPTQTGTQQVTPTQTPSQTPTLTAFTSPCVCVEMTVTGPEGEGPAGSIQYNNCFGTLVNEAFLTQGTRYRCVDYTGGVIQVFSETNVTYGIAAGLSCGGGTCPTTTVIPLTPTPTPTQTASPGSTPPSTPTQTPSNSQTETPTKTPTQTPTPSNTATQTGTPTQTPTQTPTTPCVSGDTNATGNCSSGDSGTFTLQGSYNVNIVPSGFFYSGTGNRYAYGYLYDGSMTLIQSFEMIQDGSNNITYNPTSYTITTPGTYTLSVNQVNCSNGSGSFTLTAQDCFIPLPSSTPTQTPSATPTIGITPSQTSSPTPTPSGVGCVCLDIYTNNSLDISINDVQVDGISATYVGGTYPNTPGNGTSLCSNITGTVDVTVFYSSSVPGQNMYLIDSNSVQYCINTATGSNSYTFTNVELNSSQCLAIQANDGGCV